MSVGGREDLAKGTALQPKPRGGHSKGSPALSTSPSVRAPQPCDQNRHWKIGDRKQLDSPMGEEGGVSCLQASNLKEDSWRRFLIGRQGSRDSETETQSKTGQVDVWSNREYRYARHIFCQIRASGIKSQNSQAAVRNTSSRRTRSECLFLSVTRRKLVSLG